MQPTGTESACPKCVRRTLRRRVAALQRTVMERDTRIAELEAKGRDQARTLEGYAETYKESYRAVCDLAARLEGQRDRAEADAADQATRRGRLEGRVRELEAALARAGWSAHADRKAAARIAELEGEVERLRAECKRLEAHEPVAGRTLRFFNPRHVTLKRPGHCSVTDHVPEWVEVKL